MKKILRFWQKKTCHQYSINQLKEKYCTLLLQGTYCDTDNYSNENPGVQARCFVNGNELAIVLTKSIKESAKTMITVPGYGFKESSGVGNFIVDNTDNKQHISIDKDALVIVKFNKNRY